MRGPRRTTTAGHRCPTARCSVAATWSSGPSPNAGHPRKARRDPVAAGVLAGLEDDRRRQRGGLELVAVGRPVGLAFRGPTSNRDQMPAVLARETDRPRPEPGDVQWDRVFEIDESGIGREGL